MTDIVVAWAHGGVIGSKNDLPWYLPADLKHFKELTTGGTVLMGRNTYKSILNHAQGPLPNRRNIVVSTQLKTVATGFEVYSSLDQAMAAIRSNEAVHIIGGAVLYAACLGEGLIDRIYLTEVDADIAGDTYFPELAAAEWQETARQSFPADARNPYSYSFVTLEHVQAA